MLLTRKNQLIRNNIDSNIKFFTKIMLDIMEFWEINIYRDGTSPIVNYLPN